MCWALTVATLRQDIIFGPIDSHCTIVFKSLRSASNYQVTFKRHIPVSSWVRWEEQGGMHAAMAPPLKQSPPFMQAPVVPMNQVSVPLSFRSPRSLLFLLSAPVSLPAPGLSPLFSLSLFPFPLSAYTLPSAASCCLSPLPYLSFSLRLLAPPSVHTVAN